jgi:ribokinase
MRVAVVGHVEWVTFARVPQVPRPGQIVHAQESWSQAAGGGGVAALELARLAGRAELFTAVGDDDTGRRVRASLEGGRLALHAAARAEPHPQVFTFLDGGRERTITVLHPPLAPRGGDPLDWSTLDRVDAVYFCKGDAAAVRQARRARVLVATARAIGVLREAQVRIDVLVRSAHDAGEAYAPGDLTPAPDVVVATEGGAGGWYDSAAGAQGRWSAVAPPSPIMDSYGAGDCFAAALTFALASGRALDDALAFAAERGALALGRRGAGDT